MQLQDAFSIPKIFIGLDIKKKLDSFYQTDLFFTRPIRCLLMLRICINMWSAFSDHAVDLVYEAGCCGFSAARYFLNLGWNVLVNPSDVKRGDKERYQKTDALDSKNLSIN
jgi:hypothetical protein